MKYSVNCRNYSRKARIAEFCLRWGELCREMVNYLGGLLEMTKTTWTKRFLHKKNKIQDIPEVMQVETSPSLQALVSKSKTSLCWLHLSKQLLSESMLPPRVEKAITWPIQIHKTSRSNFREFNNWVIVIITKMLIHCKKWYVSVKKSIMSLSSPMMRLCRNTWNRWEKRCLKTRITMTPKENRRKTFWIRLHQLRDLNNKENNSANKYWKMISPKLMITLCFKEWWTERWMMFLRKMKLTTTFPSLDQNWLSRTEHHLVIS